MSAQIREAPENRSRKKWGAIGAIIMVACLATFMFIFTRGGIQEKKTKGTIAFVEMPTTPHKHAFM